MPQLAPCPTVTALSQSEFVVHDRVQPPRPGYKAAVMSRYVAQSIWATACLTLGGLAQLAHNLVHLT